MFLNLKNIFKLFFFSIFITGLLFLFTLVFTISNLGIASFTAYVFAFFIFIPAAYFFAIKRIHWLYVLKEQGILHKIFSRKAMSYTLLHLFSIFLSWYTLAQLRFFNVFEWIITFFSIFMFFLLYKKVKGFYSKEVEAFIGDGLSLRTTTLLSALISSLIYTLIFTIDNNIITFNPLIDEIVSKEWTFSKSALLTLLFDIFSLKSHIEKSTFIFLKDFKEVSHIVFFIFNFFTFLSISSLASIFFLNKNELRRIITLERTEKTRSVSKKEAFSLYFIITFLTAFLYTPLVATMEAQSRNLINIKNTQSNKSQIEFITAEQIDGKLYKPGTIKKIQETKKVVVMKTLNMHVKKAKSLINKIFLKMENNVDSFLDWYYSLKGEYTRITILLAGNFEEFLRKKLMDSLLKEGTIKELISYIKNSDFLIKKDAKTSLNREISDILKENEITYEDIKNKQVLIIRKANLLNLQTFSLEDLEKFNFIKERIGGTVLGSGGTVALSYMITKKISSVIVKKGTTKKLAKVLAKKISEKVAIRTAATAIGSAVGSVVPGIGTAIGGVVASVAAGVIIDKALIEADEAMHREEFKKEIIDSIRKAKEEFMKNLETDQNI